MIAPDLAERGAAIRAAVDGGAALLAVCGGYQLLGRGYRGRDGSWMPGAALFPHETVAGEQRMIGDVLLESALARGSRRDDRGLREPRGPNVARRRRSTARPGRRGLRQRRRVGLRGRARRAGDRDVPARPAPAAQPVARGSAALLGDRARDGRRAGAARAARGRPRARGARRRRRRGRDRAAGGPPRRARYSAQRAPR